MRFQANAAMATTRSRVGTWFMAHLLWREVVASLRLGRLDRHGRGLRRRAGSAWAGGLFLPRITRMKRITQIRRGNRSTAQVGGGGNLAAGGPRSCAP